MIKNYSVCNDGNAIANERTIKNGANINFK